MIVQRKKSHTTALLVGCLLAFSACRSAPERQDSIGGPVARVHLLNDVPLDAGAGAFNAVIEIGAGDTAKMEVDKTSGEIVQDMENGAPRFIRYMGYPANYGFLPQTLLSKKDGGDGDALDVVVLGPRRQTGDVIKVEVIGVLQLRDRGEVDDKIIAVDPDGAFAGVDSMTSLEAQFPGVKEQIEQWFSNYKGPGQMVANGYADRADALVLVQTARRAAR